MKARNNVKIRHSIVTRFGVFFILLLLLAVLLSGFLVYKESAATVRASAMERLENIKNLSAQRYYSLLDEVSNDIAVLSANELLLNYFEDPTPDKANLTNNLFESFLVNKPDYFQIRLISAIEYGQEIIRFDKIDQKIIRVPRDQLQNKGNRFYFQETLKIGKGNFYFSPINLNEEFGIISMPFTPTLRAASALENPEGNALGILIINVDMSRYFDQLRQIAGANFEIMLIDADDQYLFSPDINKSFGRQLMNEHSFKNDFDTSVLDLYQNRLEIEQLVDRNNVVSIYDIEQITYAEGHRNLFLIVSMKESLLLRSLRLVQQKSFKLVLIISLLALLAAILFTRFFSKTLLEITAVIASYSDPDKSLTSTERLPVKRQDEIGILARTFQDMKNKIDEQVMALRQALQKEHKAIRDRDEFLQNMSHELRTPLHSIIGLSKLLEKNNPSNAQLPIIKSLIKSADNLSGLLHDVLDHQKLKEGAITIDLKPGNISNILYDIHATYQYAAVQKGLNFTHQIDQELSHQEYLTDPLRLTQIVTNLVVNAIKYTEEGTIEMKAAILEDGKSYSIKISDSGIGIKSENLDQIRDRFYRENSSVSSEEGFGLGLSIVRELLILFNGSLEITSTPEAGSTFEVVLPLISASRIVEDIEDMEEDHLFFPSLEKEYNILHIEDDEASVLLMQHELNGLPFSLFHAENFQTAKDLLEEQDFDLIISDLMIGGVNIRDKVRALQGKYADIPVMLVSAADYEVMEEISKAFLQKPFDQHMVASYLFVLLGDHAYETPTMSRMYRQYDHDHNSIMQYLNILINEFEGYSLRFDEIYQEKNQDLWHAQRHRLSTHLRSLGLEKVLDRIPKNVTEITSAELTMLTNQLRFCLCYFKVQRNQFKSQVVS